MEPLISPSTIYLIHCLHALQGLCILGLPLSLIFIIIFIVMPFDNKEYLPYAKISIVAFVLFLLGVVFIPNQELLIKMLVFSQITPDNATMPKEDLINLIKQVSDLVKSL